MSANLAGLVDGPSRARAAAPAVLVGDEVVRTWGGFAAAVARRAGGLGERLDVGAGDRVALFAGNHARFLETLFAIWHAGAVAVPISSRLHAREAAALLEAASARACFVTDDVGNALAEQAPAARLVAFGDADDRALEAAAPVAPVARRPDDDAWIFFTSGTTGRAKGARLTHGNLLAMAAAHHADVSPIGPEDALLHVAALSHASGLFSLPFVARGAAQVLPASGGFDAAELLGLVAAHERSSFFLPPTLLRRLCAAPQLAETPVERRLGTVLVGAAPVRAGDLRAGNAALGPCLWNGYGQGESPCTITALDSAAIAQAVAEGDEDRLGSVGVARWATRVRVLDSEGAELPAGEVGEVVVDGPTVMHGYLDAPEATAQALRGGWLHTGDLGRLDGSGQLTLVDRASDVVITGGYNVYPREVEDVLSQHPAVADVAVVGLADEEWGERVAAFVVVREGAALDDGELDALCLERIARHKRPREYRVVAELPRNAAGKVVKAQLRRELPHDAR